MTYFCVEVFSVCIRPPIIQVSIAVKTGTGIIESVRNFVTDYGPNSTKIYGRICFKMEKRRLKDCSRENDFVVGTAVISLSLIHI